MADSFDRVLETLDAKAQRDRGTLFEELMVAYFKHEPRFQQLFSHVWMLKDAPDDVAKNDTGVDLVAENIQTGRYTAIQCKFYAANKTIYKEDIDSFFTEMGKRKYSDGIIVSTTDRWGKNAEDALDNRDKPVVRLSLSDLRNSKVNWEDYSLDRPSLMQIKSDKQPRSYQRKAIEATVKGFKTSDRGKLIMACGTGKTYTSLKIAETMEKLAQLCRPYRVLYLVPSLSLLSQTLKGWTNDTSLNMQTFAICSDRKVTKRDEDLRSVDIGFQSTTDTDKLLDYVNRTRSRAIAPDMSVFFSTYQSIDVISRAQNKGLGPFDLIICDEAHRTTGAKLSDEDESSFTKVHYNEYIQGNKRLYQTATPRIYKPETKDKATEKDIILASMDDESIYGKEFYRLTFGEAVERDILSDYKVMVLGVDEHYVSRTFQHILSNNDSELRLGDVAKIIGCWNGLIKRKPNRPETSGEPMHRAVAFTQSIAASKQIAQEFQSTISEYINTTGSDDVLQCEVQHVDGSFNALKRNRCIDWLKGNVNRNECRILSNARCLTEGIDIPELDAILFLNPRKSEVDIIQAVGRVMRKAEGKKYGYIILPIGVPSITDPKEVLDNNDAYQVVWKVLQALRAHDERFDSIINKIELNNSKPKNVDLIGIGGEKVKDTSNETGVPNNPKDKEDQQLEWNLDWKECQNAIYGKIVKKVGSRRYWESWSSDVAKIAQQHFIRIQGLVEKDKKIAKAFDIFLKSLKHNINAGIDERQAIQMLSQHLITKPVFQALFDQTSFINQNPVSKAMERMIKALNNQALETEQKSLDKFYESVKLRASGIDNAAGKQKVILELYNDFFKNAFSDTTARLGVVFTPVEVVDFIINSVNDTLKKYFNLTLSDKGIHILDPFVGTGTFMTRLLQVGVIKPEDLLRKYTQEMHANEIILLSYYIAAINIEQVFHDLMPDKYRQFKGIVLTDTFESTEKEDSFADQLFNENDSRLRKQQQQPIFAIISNPPYSVGQQNQNDNRQNQHYPKLEEEIENTYVKYSKSGLSKGVYDSYIKAFRWATDRIKEQGVIGFVTNGSYLDSKAADGLRKCLYDEFNYLYVFNLRGNQRTQGEQSRKEGGKIFGSGSRAPVAISILVKDGSPNHQLYYHDIGDYLDRDQKLSILHAKQSIKNINWKIIQPDKNNDWLNQRNEHYQKFISLSEKNKTSIFNNNALGVTTNRDSWVYGFNKDKMLNNISKMISNYNLEVQKTNKFTSSVKLKIANRNEHYIKWTRKLEKRFKHGDLLNFNRQKIVLSMYRPFTKKWLFYDENVIEEPRLYYKKFGKQNFVIYTTGRGAVRPFSAIITDIIPNLHMMDTGQGFMRYDNEKSNNLTLFDTGKDNLSHEFADKLGLSIDDTFYYVYGVLHSKVYREKYQNDLKKDIARIPILKYPEAWSEAGRKLADLHLNYENAEPYDGVTIEAKDNPSYRVKKMKHPHRGDLSTIVYNTDIKIHNIPDRAYDYVVNGRPAIEWILDQYQVKTDKKSGITDDPNDYSNDPKYIFNLLLQIITVSLNTLDIVDHLPKYEEQVSQLIL
jgi:predicted helicase